MPSASLQDHVDLEAASSRIARQLAAAQRQNAGDLPVRQGSGSMTWPVNGPVAGAFGEQRPGHIRAGIDIAAAQGTPIHAADDGRVVLMQGVGASGGYGNHTCVQHRTTLSTCYAHQSRFATSAGTKVGKGEVIGYVGNAGHSFGAHLHFEVRVLIEQRPPLRSRLSCARFVRTSSTAPGAAAGLPVAGTG